MSAYVIVSAAGIALYQDGLIDPAEMEGPPAPPPDVTPHVAHLLLEPIDWSAQPSPTCVLRWPSLEWEEASSLVELKATKNAEIDRARETANRTYFDFAGMRIACGDIDWKDIMSASAEISLTHEMPADWVGFWKGKDDEGNTQYVPIPDVATWTLFIQAMVARGQTHFRKSQDMKAQLAAATTPEQIAAITWGAGPTQPLENQ